MPKSALSILKDFFQNQLILEGGALVLSDDGTNTTLELSNLYNLRKGMSITIDSTAYEVVSIDRDTCQVVVIGVIASASTYIVPNPSFYVGSVAGISVQWQYESSTDTFPAIHWLYPTQTISPTESIKPLYQNTRIELRVLDTINTIDLTELEKAERLEGLEALSDGILNQLRTYPSFGNVSAETRLNMSTFGTQRTNTGAVSSQYQEALSGIILRFVLPINTNCNC